MKKERLMNLVVRVEEDLLHRFKMICVRKKWTQARMIREYIEAICKVHESEDKKNAINTI